MHKSITAISDDFMEALVASLMAGQRPGVAKLHRAFGNSLQRACAERFAVGPELAREGIRVSSRWKTRSVRTSFGFSSKRTVWSVARMVLRPAWAFRRTTLISKIRRLGINRGQSSASPVRAVA